METLNVCVCVYICGVYGGGAMCACTSVHAYTRFTCVCVCVCCAANVCLEAICAYHTHAHAFITRTRRLCLYASFALLPINA